MKKIIFSLAIIAATAAIVIGGTVAFFSDTETSTGNTFTAGAIDLKIDSKCTWNGVQQAGCTWLTPKDLAAGDLFFNYNDVKPGDTGEDTISLHVATNDAYVCAEISNLNTTERGCNEAEAEVDSSCGTTDLVQGELQNNLFFTIWKDTNCDNILNNGEQVLVANEPATNGYWPIADSSSGGPLAGNTTACIGVSWEVPSETGNIIQGDGMSADVTFSAIQARNIPQYFCTAQGGCAPQAEICDGVDNDCDGNIDEGWTLGGECSAGLGACYATGTYTCNSANPAGDAICSATPGQTSTEICTGGADEDCDGTIDCGDTNCANDAACQAPSNISHLDLENKNGNWNPIIDGTYGDLDYNPAGPTFDWSLNVVGLTPTTQYRLIYAPDPWPQGIPPSYTVKTEIKTFTTDSSGNYNGSGSTELNMDLPDSRDTGYASNYAKVWIVLASDHNTYQMTDWHQSSYLLDMQSVNYDDTDVANLETITLNDFGAASQYGYYHSYAGANVTFAYTTPASNKLTGTVTATGLKPYATYQLKFNGKPVCQYGSAGDDAANEQIGYMGRWWDNTTNSNTNDAGYVANHTTHCISGYLVWGYITADASGNATKVVTTDSGYHVLWSGGGVCNTNVNTFLAHPDAAHPTVWFSPADKVNGQLERGTCGGLIFSSGDYKLGMILNEESFHMGPGTWTAVMGKDIEFKIN